ncbi:hypothetical protein G6F56_006766 [Rhizopus delemar]|nr:hypothetical protein G6F56_006766 [Rhizopus delemar]
MISLRFLLFICIILSVNAAALPKPSNKHIKLPLLKRSRNNSTVKLYNELKTEYLVKISVGTPPQEFIVALDTGSSDTWIPSVECSKDECESTRYNSSTSSTFNSTSMSFNISYAQGRVSAKYGKDTMRVGDATVKQQTFGLATSIGDKIIAPTNNNITSNGIFGLGFPGLTANSNTDQAYEPFLFSLAKQNLIPEPIFSVYLGSMDDAGWSGELGLGSINPERYTGNLTYVPVQQNVDYKTNKTDYTYWSIGIQEINVIKNNQSQSVNTTTPSLSTQQNAMLDTGTTYTYLSKDAADKIVKLITRRNVQLDALSGLYMVDCSLKTSGIKLELVIAAFENQSVRWQIDIEDLILTSTSGGNQCGFGITFTDTSNNNFILGDTILRSSYLVFDMGQKRVGIASAVNMKSKVM